MTKAKLLPNKEELKVSSMQVTLDNQIIKTPSKRKNMYSHAVQRVNIGVGCLFDCVYCKKSFKAQLRRQINNCLDCGEYHVHFHEDRLRTTIKKTPGQYEFIWLNAFSDISYLTFNQMEKILGLIDQYPDRTFFLQTKKPSYLLDFQYPENLILGITLETNRDSQYLKDKISKAPLPSVRYKNFLKLDHSRKSVTIEPILDFDYKEFVAWIRAINPERVYVGYDTKKNNLREPSFKKVHQFMKQLACMPLRLFPKYIPFVYKICL